MNEWLPIEFWNEDTQSYKTRPLVLQITREVTSIMTFLIELIISFEISSGVAVSNFGKSRLESALELGIAFEVAPKLSIEDGIEAVRKALPNCWFDKNKCQKALENLKAYQKRWDDKNQCFRNKPMHNYASHCADSFRTGIVGEGVEVSDWDEEIPVETNYIV